MPRLTVSDDEDGDGELPVGRHGLTGHGNGQQDVH